MSTRGNQKALADASRRHTSFCEVNGRSSGQLGQIFQVCLGKRERCAWVRELVSGPLKNSEPRLASSERWCAGTPGLKNVSAISDPERQDALFHQALGNQVTVARVFLFCLVIITCTLIIKPIISCFFPGSEIFLYIISMRTQVFVFLRITSCYS